MTWVNVALRNDLVGSRVLTDGPPTPVVTPLPSVKELPDESAQSFPKVLTVYTVTRAMFRKVECDQEQTETSVRLKLSPWLYLTLLSVSHSDLAAEQHADLSPSKLFDNVLFGVDARSAAKDYLVHDNFMNGQAGHLLVCWVISQIKSQVLLCPLKSELGYQA